MSRTGRIVREGMTTGFIGYAAVAVFYAIVDTLAARGPFFTLDLLGKAVFRGVRDPALLFLPMEPDLVGMLAYNFLHLTVALGVGLLVAYLVAAVEERPATAYPVLTVLLAGYLVTIATVGLLGQELLPLLPWWSIVVVNTLAAICAGAYLLRAHPGLLRRAREAS